MAEPTFDVDWAGRTKTRVLIGAREWGDRGLIAVVLRHAGYSTAGCSGPHSRPGRCPLLTGGRCPAVEEADVIVCALPPSARGARDVVSALRERFPDRPLVLDGSWSEIEDGAAGKGCTFIEPGLSEESVLDAVERALDSVSRSRRE